jgi:hypothetical protein
MSKLKKLEVKKLLKELDFLTSDLDYKNELVFEADNNFIKDVNKFLDNNPEVKKIFDRKIDDRLNKIIMEKVEKTYDENIIPDETEDIIIKKDDKIRKIYREIAKKTHPDKVDNKKLNDIYIKASTHYDDNDIIQIYSICDELGIDYDIDDTDDKLIITKIDNIRQKIKFIESTTTWKWFYTEDDGLKNEIILNYIRSQIK